VASPFARKRYYEKFCSVELQQTFYNLPSLDYARRLREEAPQGFIYTMKAWQVITHPPTSPTWRRLRHKPPGRLENYGYLRPTKENLEAWRRTLAFAHELGARIIVLQTPPSFRYSDENREALNKFFKSIDRGGVAVGWEPRGEWSERREAIKEIVCMHNIIHVVDPLRREPVICKGQSILYFRLHGLGGRGVNYRYKYSEDDLKKLVKIIDKLIKMYTVGEVYTMFNNIYMAQNAALFKTIATEYFDEDKVC